MSKSPPLVTLAPRVAVVAVIDALVGSMMSGAFSILKVSVLGLGSRLSVFAESWTRKLKLAV
jgi:hypothetical protein